MGEGRGKEGGGSQLLTKSRLVSISHPHHPLPLGGAGGAGRGQGREVRLQQHTRASLQGPFQGRPLGGVRGSGFCSPGHGRGWGALPAPSLSPESDNDDDITQD